MVVVIPSVSIGNVPQLAVDLLLHSYDFQLVATLDDEYLSPFVGPQDRLLGDEPQPGGVATALQLYRLSNIWVVQLRSPPLPGSKKKLMESLKEQLPELVPFKDLETVVVAGSANRGMRLDLDADLITTVTDSTEVLPESGMVKQVLEVLGGRALVAWSYEGDNVDDALALVTVLQKELGLPEKPWRPPLSWERMYGKDIPLGIEKGLYT